MADGAGGMSTGPGNEILHRTVSLCERTLFLDAYAELSRLGPPEKLPSGRASVVGARLVNHLGAPKRAQRLFLAEYRRNPRDPWARLAAESVRWELRGPWAVRESLERAHIGEDADRAVRCDALEYEALASLFYRDFAMAQSVLDRWAAIHPEDPDLALSRAEFLERSDRLAEGLAFAEAARTTHPHHRRLLLETSRLLALSDRCDDALALLAGALETMQSSDVARMMYAVAISIRAPREAMRAVQRLVELTPLAEPETAAAIHRMRAEAHFRLGEMDEAAAIAREHEADPAMKRLVERVARHRPSEPVRGLNVPFVRQHHLTCAPATLAALCAFFERPAEHVQVADRICYAGTPAHAERAWAEERGFLAREFTLTWDSAVALLDRGLPFVVSTFVPGSGHAQAMMGYDARDRTLVLRDPTIPLPMHVDAEGFLEEYRHSGPRALVLVPSGDASRLEGCPLPDAALYDELHALERALSSHDREAARASCARMQHAAPGHRLTRAARRAVSSYDGNLAEVLAMSEEAVALDPTNHLARLDAVAASGALEGRAARLLRLTQAADACPGSPVFRLRLAGELTADAREHGRVRRMLYKVLAEHAESAEALRLLAHIAWFEGKPECAVGRWRAAACVDLTDDEGVRQYVWAARRSGRTEEALQVVRERVTLFGARSAEPAVLLADVLQDTGNTDEALRVLEMAEKRRPDDGAPPLAVAQYHAKLGRGEETRAALERARGKVDRASWLRAAASTSASIGAPADEQLASWQELARQVPLDVQAHHTVAVLLRRTQGRTAGIAYLREHRARFPHHVPSARLAIGWLRDAEPDVRERALRAWLDAEPHDAWAHRELALILGDRHRWDEARDALEQAAALEPHSPSLAVVRGSIADRRGDHAAARIAYRAGLDMDADVPTVLARLVVLAPPAEREGVIADLFRVVERGAIEGETFEALYSAANPYLSQESPETMSKHLERLREHRPEVVAVWAVSMRHTLAPELAEQALSRFPFSDDIHLQAAHVWRVALGDGERELDALERAVELGPRNVAAVLQFAQALEARGQREKLDAVLLRASHRSSFDPVVALHTARVRARRGDTAAAVREFERILDSDPECEPAWDAVHEMGSYSDEARTRIRETVRRLADGHPFNERAQTMHAAYLASRGATEEACALLDAARARMPGSVHVRDQSARILALLGRSDEAIRACGPYEGEGRLPVILRARAAWVHLVGGDRPRGIEALRRVLEEDPSLTGAWQWLIDALFEARAQREAMEAAQKLAAVEPFDAGTLDRLGRALLGVGDRAGGKAALRRALERDGRDLELATNVFWLGVEDGDSEAAGAALRVMRDLLPEEQLAPYAIREAIARGDDAGAVDCFRRACADARAQRDTVEGAYRSMVSLGLGAVANGIVDEAVVSGSGANAATGALWVRSHGAREGFEIAARMDLIPAASAPGRSAAMAFCDYVASRCPRFLVASTLRERAPWLRGDDVGWSAALAPWVAHRFYVRALWWARDWRVRRSAPPARLHDLVLAFRAVGLRRRAMAVSRAAMDGEEATSHHAWLAFEEAIAGRSAEAGALLARIDADVRHGIDAEVFPAMAQRVANLARALVQVESSPREARAEAISAARSEIQSVAQAPDARPFASDVVWRSRMYLARRGQLGALFDGRTSGVAIRPGYIWVGLIVMGNLARLAREDVPILTGVLGAGMALLACYLAFRAIIARI